MYGFSKQSPKRSYANGGMIRGPGTGTSDSIKKKAKPGSYIMPADSTQKVGGFNLEKMGKPVDVNVSNGEFEMPPEQVHAVGAQVLDQMKGATHAPAKGFKPDPGQPEEVFFADGGVVEDEPHREKMRRALQRGPFGSPARVPGASGDKSPYAGAKLPSAQEAGAAVREGANRVVEFGQDVGRVWAKPYQAVGKFAKGFATGSPGNTAQASTEGQGLEAPTGGNTKNTPAGSQGDPAPVANNDPRVADWLKDNSMIAGDNVNAGNRKGVEGVDGLEYAGKYGETDVFAGTGSEGETAFSDMANLATTRGGQAADLPAEGEPGFGNTVASNASATGAPGVATGGFKRNADGSYGYVPSQLETARNAAMERGDYEAVERSYMSSDERQAADDAKGFRSMRDRARRQDPAGTYATELNQKSASQAMQAEIAQTLREQQQEQQDRRYDRGQDFIKNRQSAIESVMEYLGGDEMTGADPYSQQVATALFSEMKDTVDPSEILGATQEIMAGLENIEDPTKRPDYRDVVADYLQSRQGGGQAGNATPPPNHVAALRQNRNLAAQFDEMYGPGAAARALGEQ